MPIGVGYSPTPRVTIASEQYVMTNRHDPVTPSEVVSLCSSCHLNPYWCCDPELCSGHTSDWNFTKINKSSQLGEKNE